jgi:hypothetical protein
VRRRDRIEIFGTIGAHWPVEPCYGDERPVEVSLFLRGVVTATGFPFYPFPLPSNTPVAWWSRLLLKVPQRILAGETVTPQQNSNYDGRLRWGWQPQSWTLDRFVFANYLVLSLSKCELTLR